MNSKKRILNKLLCVWEKENDSILVVFCNKTLAKDTLFNMLLLLKKMLFFEKCKENQLLSS